MSTMCRKKVMLDDSEIPICALCAGHLHLEFAPRTLPSPKQPLPRVLTWRHHGFALPTAIFLLVVLAALGTFMLVISSVQHTTSAQDVQGTRAYHAARAGIEWGVYTIMVPENASPFVPANRAACFAAASPAFGGTLAGFAVNVTCAGGADVIEGVNTIRVFTLTSTAASGAVGSIARVERQISATVSTCRKTADGSRCDE